MRNIEAYVDQLLAEGMSPEQIVKYAEEAKLEEGVFRQIKRAVLASPLAGRKLQKDHIKKIDAHANKLIDKSQHIMRNDYKKAAIKAGFHKNAAEINRKQAGKLLRSKVLAKRKAGVVAQGKVADSIDNMNKAKGEMNAHSKKAGGMSRNATSWRHTAGFKQEGEGNETSYGNLFGRKTSKYMGGSGSTTRIIPPSRAEKKETKRLEKARDRMHKRSSSSKGDAWGAAAETAGWLSLLNLLNMEEYNQPMKVITEGGPTKKHFKQVADIISRIEDHGTRAQLAKHHATVFRKQNPNFSHEKWYKACGVQSPIAGIKKHAGVTEEKVDEAFGISKRGVGHRIRQIMTKGARTRKLQANMSQHAMKLRGQGAAAEAQHASASATADRHASMAMRHTAHAEKQTKMAARSGHRPSWEGPGQNDLNAETHKRQAGEHEAHSIEAEARAKRAKLQADHKLGRAFSWATKLQHMKQKDKPGFEDKHQAERKKTSRYMKGRVVAKEAFLEKLTRVAHNPRVSILEFANGRSARIPTVAAKRAFDMYQKAEDKEAMLEALSESVESFQFTIGNG
jgi:hypothetical protein